MKSSEALEKYYSEAKNLHMDCMRDINDYAKTDVRLTNSTE